MIGLTIVQEPILGFQLLARRLLFQVFLPLCLAKDSLHHATTLFQPV